eukprot:TRINITY_DN1349_c0_g1_i1.p1 TRINITY_DN1349_c0_g1~~TRINITY_DN1349_c0_g1_i1.p1  ORF type:complete len:432 (-),score=131.87 TRINITY_DN1349_c0_g1_i1:61-1299(-)
MPSMKKLRSKASGIRNRASGFVRSSIDVDAFAHALTRTRKDYVTEDNPIDAWLRDKSYNSLFWMSLRNTQRARNYVFATLNDPSFSNLALVIAVFILGVILLSTTCFVLSSLPAYVENQPHVLESLEAFAITVFTVEYTLKALTTSHIRWFIEFMSIIDLVVIVPYYLQLIFSHSNMDELVVIRFVHMITIFRIFKVSGYSSCLRLINKSIVRSFDSLILLLVLLFIELTIFSSLMFFLEGIGCTFDKEQCVWYYKEKFGGGVSPFQSILGTYWWCITTLTTTGYGDSFPRTEIGKTVGAVAMVFGIVTMAFPMAVLVTTFSEVLKEEAEKQKWNINKLSPNGGMPDATAQKSLLQVEEVIGQLQQAQALIDDESAKVHHLLELLNPHNLSKQEDETYFPEDTGSMTLQGQY